MATRLVDRFRLLTGGSRTAVARHQTLRSVVAWSWELLTDDERRLAESLAVFHGGMTVESAMAVSGASYDDTLELLVALADKSILQPVSDYLALADARDAARVRHRAAHRSRAAPMRYAPRTPRTSARWPRMPSPGCARPSR